MAKIELKYTAKEVAQLVARDAMMKGLYKQGEWYFGMRPSSKIEDTVFTLSFTNEPSPEPERTYQAGDWKDPEVEKIINEN